jgi:hypothetical protein
MDIHLSEETARYIQGQLAGSGCSSPSEFVERLLRKLRQTDAAEYDPWLCAQEGAAAKIRDNDADARYDAL